MDIDTKVYCEHCDDLVEFDILENQTIYDELFKTEFIGSKCMCKICGNEVISDTIEFLNMEIARNISESKLIKIEQINQLLEKYDIGATVLSTLLGWSRVTITRYLSGSLPSNKYSEQLLLLLNNPLEMYNLLKANKDNINEKSFIKSLNTTLNYINNDYLSDVAITTDNCILNSDFNYDIDLITNYILTKQSLTPKALQKILYYIQGFYKAFSGAWLFNNLPEAWVHGPVYTTIYYKYKSFEYNPIELDNIEKCSDQSIDPITKQYIDTIIKYFGCFTGDVLEEVTHLESPWLNARRGLNVNQNSNTEISQSDIEDFFLGIKSKYNMLSFTDIKDYIIKAVYN